MSATFRPCPGSRSLIDLNPSPVHDRQHLLRPTRTHETGVLIVDLADRLKGLGTDHHDQGKGVESFGPVYGEVTDRFLSFFRRGDRVDRGDGPRPFPDHPPIGRSGQTGENVSPSLRGRGVRAWGRRSGSRSRGGHPCYPCNKTPIVSSRVCLGGGGGGGSV